MKKIKLNHIWSYLAIVIAIAGFSCTPEDEELELGPKPDASFTITPVEGKINTYLLISDIKAATYQWDKGIGFKPGNDVDTAYFPLAGTYTVKMNAFTQGGMVTAENSVTVAENDPAAGCVGDEIALLTGCGDSQTWVLAGAGSLLVGPADGSGDVWWQIPAGEVEARNCVLNDQFTFFADGTFAFDNLGDIWVEASSPLGLSTTDACTSWEDVGAEYGAWGPNDNFTYSVASNKITVTGEGAFLGLYKAANGAEVQTPAEAGGSVTYDIVELTTNKLVVEINYGDGIWKFTFKPEGAEDEGDWFDGLTEGENVIAGADMTSDEFWNISDTGGPVTTTEFTEEGLKFSNTEDTHVKVWQAIEVEAGQKYKFSATVKGSGAENSWFEIYFGTSVPADGADYSDGAYTGLNTWAGCATSEFEGDLALVGCNDAPGTGQKGLVTFEESGTVYFVIKAGSSGGNLGTDGITISNVKLSEMN